LEHVARGIEKVKPIFEAHYKDQKESQYAALEIIFKAFKFSKLCH
jgi:hypothetical protein